MSPRENFPKLKKGDVIKADYLNEMAGVCERVGRSGGGSYQTGRTGTQFNASSGMRVQRTIRFEITRAVGDGVYEGKIRVFSHAMGIWKTDDKKWYIDFSDVSSSIGVGSKVSAYWDEQRGMFVPTSGGDGGTGPATIQFRITASGPFFDESLPVCNSVLAEVQHVSCNAVGVSVGDEVIVWDPYGCWLTVPLDLLIGSYGSAVEMSREGAWDVIADCIDYGVLDGTCWWWIQHLCCVETIYGQ